MLEQTHAVGGLATLLWHNDTFYEPDYPGSCDLYERALDWLSERDAHVATCGEIDRWWRAREAVTISSLPQPLVGWSVDLPAEIDGLVLRVWLPDPQARPRVREQVPTSLRQIEGEYLLEFGRLAAGSRLHIDCA